MKNYLVFTLAAMLAVTMTGCAGLYSAAGKTPGEVHDAAVAKVAEYAEAAINKRIDGSENLSDAGKEKLKTEVAKLKAEILIRIAEIKAKSEATE